MSDEPPGARPRPPGRRGGPAPRRNAARPAARPGRPPGPPLLGGPLPVPALLHLLRDRARRLTPTAHPTARLALRPAAAPGDPDRVPARVPLVPDRTGPVHPVAAGRGG